MLFFNATIFKILIFFLAVILFWPADAQTASSIKNLQKQSSDVKKEIQKKQKEVKGITREEKEMLGSLEDLELSLNSAVKRVSNSRRALKKVERRIQKIQTSLKKLRQKIQTEERYTARRAVGLYKLNCVGQTNVLANANSVADFFQRQNALKRILAYDELTLSGLDEKKKELIQIKKKLAEGRQEKDLRVKTHQKEVNLLAHQQTQRKQILASVRQKKQLMRAALAVLKQRALALDNKIKNLALAARRSVYEKKHGSGVFTSLKGLLNMPVKGKIISFFGPYKDPEFNVMNFQSGVDIQAKQGLPIHSVGDGQVIYASWFKGYGNMIIIDHGDHYYTVYAHAQELLKSEGNLVKAGEEIATVGDSGTIGGPGLHFEVRRHGKPIDPLKWLKNRQKE